MLIVAQYGKNERGRAWAGGLPLCRSSGSRSALLVQIRFMLLQNRQGKTRLSKWYVPYDDTEKQAIQVLGFGFWVLGFGFTVSGLCLLCTRRACRSVSCLLASDGSEPPCVLAGGLSQGGDSARGKVYKLCGMAHPQACIQVSLA